MESPSPSAVLLAGALALSINKAEAAEPVIKDPISTTESFVGHCNVDISPLTFDEADKVVLKMNESLVAVLEENYSSAALKRDYAAALVHSTSAYMLDSQILDQEKLVGEQGAKTHLANQDEINTGRDALSDSRETFARLEATLSILVDEKGHPRTLKSIGFDANTVEDTLRYEAAMNVVGQVYADSGVNCTAPVTAMFVDRYNFPTAPYGADLKGFKPDLLSVNVQTPDYSDFAVRQAANPAENGADFAAELRVAKVVGTALAERALGEEKFEKKWGVDPTQAAPFTIQVKFVEPKVAKPALSTGPLPMPELDETLPEDDGVEDLGQ